MSRERAWRLLAVDDDAVLLRQLKEFIEGETFDGSPTVVETEAEFEAVLPRLNRERFDVLILDIRGTTSDSSPGAGNRVFQQLMAATFVPVVFYTAVGTWGIDEDVPYVELVDKADGFVPLRRALERVFATQLPALAAHLDEELRTLLWGELGRFRPRASAVADPGEPAYTVARLIARRLAGPALRKRFGLPPAQRRPADMYLPAIEEPFPLAGDIFKNEAEEFWVVLTPSCDLVRTDSREPRVTRVLLARAKPVQPARKDEVGNLLARKDPDRHFLPAWDGHLPDVVVHFRDLATIEYDRLTGPVWVRLATMDSPYAEELTSRFLRHFGRVGVPEIDWSSVEERLRPAPEKGRRK